MQPNLGTASMGPTQAYRAIAVARSPSSAPARTAVAAPSASPPLAALRSANRPTSAAACLCFTSAERSCSVPGSEIADAGCAPCCSSAPAAPCCRVVGSDSWSYARCKPGPPRRVAYVHSGRRVVATAAAITTTTAAAGPADATLNHRPTRPNPSPHRRVPGLLPVPGQPGERHADSQPPPSLSPLPHQAHGPIGPQPAPTSAAPIDTLKPSEGALGSHAAGGRVGTSGSAATSGDRGSISSRSGEDRAMGSPVTAQPRSVSWPSEGGEGTRPLPQAESGMPQQAKPPSKRLRGPPAPRRPAPVFSDEDPGVAAAYDRLEVTVSGRDPPAPMVSYNELTSRWQVSTLLLRNAAAGFKLCRPTPVQSRVIPAMLEGRDMLAVSCTGSGKTLAYLLPTLAQLMGRSRAGTKNSAWPNALVLVPTRELAEQVYADAQVLLRGSHLKALTVHGGVSIAEQVMRIRGRFHRSGGGVDLLIATPGRLLQLVEQRRAVRLGRVSCLVVDEADTMVSDLAMWPDIRRLLSHCTLPTARQTVLVAASLPGPELGEMAGQLLRDGVSVVVGDGTGATGVVRQNVELMPETAKLDRLAELLAPAAACGRAAVAAAAADGGGGGGGGPAVVFTRTLVRAEAVARHLSSRGVGVALLHRDLSQDQRDEAMQCFRFGVTSVLVATAVASRGLNFPDVAHVVNFDTPTSAGAYVHQIGRTGRGGRPGTATTFFTPANRPAASWLRDTLRRTGSTVPPWLNRMAAAKNAKAAEAASTDGYDRTPAAIRKGSEGRAAAGGPGRVEAAATGPGGGQVEGRQGQRQPQQRRQRRRPVDVDEPVTAEAGAALFGSFLPPRTSVGGDGMDAAASHATVPSAQPVVGAVADRKHDPAHWQAVFDQALGPRRATQARGKATSSNPSRSRDMEAAEMTSDAAAGQLGRGPSAAAHQVESAPDEMANVISSTTATATTTATAATISSSGDEHSGSSGRRAATQPTGRQRRLLYEDAAVWLEAGASGGLTARPGAGKGAGPWAG